MASFLEKLTGTKQPATVDGILSDLTEKVEQLKALAQQQSDLALQKQDEADAALKARDVAEAEEARALSVAEKFTALLGL